MHATAEHALVTLLVVAALGVPTGLFADSAVDVLVHTMTRAAPSNLPGEQPRDLPVDVVGDLTTARHVVVLVPGTGADAASHPALVRRAGTLADAMRGHDEAVAVVAWTGYRAPGGLVDATDDGYADVGADRLTRYLRALQRRRAGTTDVTVVGHSYGALVAARAAARGAPMRRLVLVGAPGLGRPFRTTRDLRRDDLVIWSADAHDDPIRLLHVGGRVGVHGGDSAGKVSGARRLPTEAHDASGVRRPASSGHSGYFDVDSAGLANLARVAVGLEPLEAPPHRRPVGPP